MRAEALSVNASGPTSAGFRSQTLSLSRESGDRVNDPTWAPCSSTSSVQTLRIALVSGILKPMPTEPTPSTLKRLFALSGNRCAFPRCPVPAIDARTGRVAVEVAHIKGESPGGPRYDPSQTDDERRHFDNLLLLCRNHHGEVDHDEAEFTVEHLRRVKSEHEEGHRNDPVDESLAARVIAALSNVEVHNGSVIVSNNQHGGQIAHSIVNMGPVARQLSPAAFESISARLRRLPAPPLATISAPAGSTEAQAFAAQIRGLLMASGWGEKSVDHAHYAAPPVGVVAKVPSVHPSMQALLDELSAAGIHCRVLIWEDPSSCLAMGVAPPRE